MPDKSESLFAAARQLMPGGVSSPVRAWRAVGGSPFFVSHASGSRIHDVDGKSYIDYVLAYGPLILGHAHPEIVAAVASQVGRGLAFGAPTEQEVRLATALTEAIPSLEMVRLVSSGTEAVMSALRVARAATGRPLVVKAEGGYHGHLDALLSKAGSGAATFGVPDSAGVSEAVARETLTVPYNDAGALEQLLDAVGDQVAAVILEPVAGNMGCVPPAHGYLAKVRELTSRRKILLVLDEIITGFRLTYGGAQQIYGIKPDLTCLGKIVGAGLPLACYGGRRDLMSRVSPEGPVYQAGTLSGNPLATTAGLKMLDVLRRPGTYDRLEALAATLEGGLRQAAHAAGVPVAINRVGSMLTLFFTPEDVTDFASARTADTVRYARFFQEMTRRGVFLPPSQFECLFLSLAHQDGDVMQTLAAAREAFAACRNVGA